MVIKGGLILILLLSSCSYDTKNRCDYRWSHEMNMKTLVKKCNYIPHGDAWMIKDTLQ